MLHCCRYKASRMFDDSRERQCGRDTRRDTGGCAAQRELAVRTSQTTSSSPSLPQHCSLARILETALESLFERVTVKILANEDEAVDALVVAPRRESLSGEEHVHALVH